MMDFGLLIIRLIIGITFMGHGAQNYLVGSAVMV